MKKTIATLLLSTFALSSSFAAEMMSSTTPNTNNPRVTSAEKLTCASNAVLKREDVIIGAHDVMAVSIKTALTARRDSLKAAWSIADKYQREVAKKAAWSKFKTDMQAAHNTMREARKSTWKNFDTEMKACGIRDHGEKAQSVGNPTYAY